MDQKSQKVERVTYFEVSLSQGLQRFLMPPYKLSPKMAKCGHFGRWTSCASKCPPKCSTRDIQDQIYCIDLCVEGCRCNPGYILDDDSGLCVLPESCKRPEEYKKKPTEEVTSHCSGYCT
ncbi:zonadhesin isoform X2 [Belonocnema kinseyi]|uniref:zonadhesin isoform X2 n=1 Tax=Belonocnema kinseyi TaxID=2817044 RepID=UPI00143D9F96|nr:zonadhesin isoform X2 [Belonocnema kinseyi]